MTDFDVRQFSNWIWGHGAALGYAYHAHGDDWAELALPYAESLIGDPTSGVIASGPIVALMDMAASLGIWAKIGRFKPIATLDLRVDYLRPATPGKTVIGHGECYRLTPSIAFVRGQAHDGDPADPLAHIAGTYMFLKAPA
ncbi:PaaI family thioesterase [Sphingomonas sp. PB2P19]|uniref:PaaI family thioesterase n=1 Tax=Sphingomonas rhamnosi TaxID=3096156 RepID=UPI002FCC872E